MLQSRITQSAFTLCRIATTMLPRVAALHPSRRRLRCYIESTPWRTCTRHYFLSSKGGEGGHGSKKPGNRIQSNDTGGVERLDVRSSQPTSSNDPAVTRGDCMKVSDALTDAQAQSKSRETESKPQSAASSTEIDRFLHPVNAMRQEDLNFLVRNFTAPALAAGLRDREDTLKLCATLLEDGKLDDLGRVLRPFAKHKMLPDELRSSTQLGKGQHLLLKLEHMEAMRYRLQRMPRHVTRATARRASVLIPLCFREGVPSVLLTKRSDKVKSHKSEVCFPGGMVDETDLNVVATSLREMEEEVGISESQVEVLGILRCNWTEVNSITGIGVTPVVGFVGDLDSVSFDPNENEVDEWFTIPLIELMEVDRWVERAYAAPVFAVDDKIVWGLTSYLLRHFIFEICLPALLWQMKKQNVT